MNRIKALAALVLAIGLAVVGGWVWGGRGASSAQSALVDSGVRLHGAGVRINLLQARVDLFETNFGNASRSLESARADLVTLEGALTRDGRADAARSVQAVMARIADAQQRTARLDQGAQAAVVQALTALDNVLGAVK